MSRENYNTNSTVLNTTPLQIENMEDYQLDSSFASLLKMMNSKMNENKRRAAEELYCYFIRQYELSRRMQDADVIISKCK
jgi:hypothetical protein